MRRIALQLSSPRLEMTALKSIMSGDQVASWILPRVSADHFGVDSCKEVYNRMMRYVRKGGTPRWDDLIEDMALSQETREEMAVSTAELVPNRKIAKRLVERLDEYRRVRIFFEMTVKTGSILKADKIDLDELTDKIADYLFKARSTGDVTESMIHVGDEKLDTKFIERLLVGDEMEFLPTGFRAFDSRNQGVPRGSLFLIAGTTGGGKCLLGSSNIETSNIQTPTMTIKEIWDSFKTPVDAQGFKEADYDLFVQSHTGEKRRITKAYKTRGKPMRVTFSSGIQVTGLPEHKLWIRNAQGESEFKRLDEIQLGDVAIIHDPPTNL